MMEQYFAKLSNLVSLETIANDINLFDDTVEDALNNILYKNLIINTSKYNDVQIYALVLLIEEFNTKLFGSGLTIVFFPGGQKIEIPVDLEIRWEVFRHINNFESNKFAHSPQVFFDLLLSVASISEEEFIETVVNVFVQDDAPYRNLTSKIRDTIIAYNNGSINIQDADNNIFDNATSIQNKLDELLSELQDGDTPFLDETKQIATAIHNISTNLGIDLNLYQLVYESIVKDLPDPAQRLNCLIELFSVWLGDFGRKDLEDLLIPKATLVFNDISLAIKFPRKWLQPIDPATNEVYTNTEEKSCLAFNVGSLQYSTQTGFHFQGENSFSFTRSQIGNTGLTLDISDMKLDLSRKTNIPEATADGRSVDFMGVYAQKAIIGLPEKWFEQDNGSTLGIFGRNLLIGTGGISGKIGLEATGASSSEDEMFFTLGKKGTSAAPRKGFKIGFKQFHMLWQQNALIESSIKGSLYLPKFKKCVQQSDGSWSAEQSDLYISIEALFEQNGDFQVTAKPTGGLSFCLDGVFIFTIDSLEVGKDDNKVFLCLSGAIRFDNNNILKSILKDPIEIKQLCIYSDGSFEIAGGSIPVPDSVKLKLGPTEVYITNLTFGAEERERNSVMLKYKYFGFDCGVSAGNAGLDLRGDGLKYYFSVNHQELGQTAHRFLRIAGIGIDLVIPGNASKESAAVIINGYLSLKEEEYRGDIALRLPKAKIAGGASMVMNPKEPAWVVDAFLDLAVPIPLGPSGLGIYGFRGLVGKRYIATKEAIGLNDEDRWFDYYKKNVPSEGEGMHVGKLATPEETEGASNPFSIGAGLTLATTADDGKAFSLQAFLLLSLPDLIFIQGKANILGERVGLTGDDPPFFAFVAFEPGHSVEFGMGADYKERKPNGRLISLNAEVEAAYFMRNSSAWFVNFGTQEKPVTARILSLFNAYSYLMLSASGIEAGAGVDFGFKKKYGPVKVEVGVYMDIWGTLSYQGAQIGAGIAVGGKVAASVFGIGLGIAIHTTLEGTVPKPFRIAGTVEVCVSVKLLVKKFEKCFDVEFIWKKTDDRDEREILPLPELDEINDGKKQIPVSGVHIGSGNTYPVNYFSTHEPSIGEVTAVVPLDTYIDIQFNKAVHAGAVAAQIGGVTNAPSNHRDLIPPKPAYRRVTHSYTIHEIEISAANLNDTPPTSWTTYHPYEALTVGSGIANTGVNPTSFKLGFFQKTGKEYNKIRFLAQTPLSYMETSAGGYTPEQMGITSSTLFCEDEHYTWHCARWQDYESFQAGQWYAHQGLTIVMRGKNGQVIDFTNLFAIPQSLCIPQGGTLEILLPEACLSVSLKLYTFTNAVNIQYLAADHQQDNSFVQYNEVLTQEYTGNQLYQPIHYESQDVAINKIVITPLVANTALIQQIEQEVDRLQRLLYLNADENGNTEELENLYAAEMQAMASAHETSCSSGNQNNGGTSTEIQEEILNCNQQLQDCNDRLEELQQAQAENCNRCEELAICLSACLKKIEAQLQREDLSQCIGLIQKKLIAHGYMNEHLEELFRKLAEQLRLCNQEHLQELYETILEQIAACQDQCNSLEEEITNLQEECGELEDKIDTLNEFLENNEGGYSPNPTACPCGTYIHEVCWMTMEEVLFNESIPGQDAVEEDYQLAQAAIQHVISPIWRSNTVYKVRISVSDSIDGATPIAENIFFGFRTSGPLGHFPADKIANTDSNPDPPSSPFDKKIESPENALKYYIDYQKSFPNPSGNILGQKPLYYKNPRLGLFYTKPYIYHFFHTWETYKNTLDRQEGLIEILIKDPVEDIGQTTVSDHTSAVFTLPVETEVFWEDDTDPIIPEDIQVYNALRNPEINNPNYPGANCWASGGDPIIPASQGTTVIPKHLQPLKLYTAIVRNVHRGLGKEVHSYAFQTSRFGSFAEHINSYHLSDSDGNSRDAIFRTEIDLERDNSNAQVNINRAFNMVVNNPNNLNSYNKNLAKTYSDPFQRLVNGHLQLQERHPTVGLHFDFIYEASTDKVIALLIESVEPLNDPRIPFDLLRPTIKVQEEGTYRYDYFPLFSKDCTKVILMNSSRQITASDLRIHFEYLEWNGQQYDVSADVMTDNLILQP